MENGNQCSTFFSIVFRPQDRDRWIWNREVRSDAAGIGSQIWSKKEMDEVN